MQITEQIAEDFLPASMTDEEDCGLDGMWELVDPPARAQAIHLLTQIACELVASEPAEGS
jgi:hypothetical protein